MGSLRDSGMGTGGGGMGTGGGPVRDNRDGRRQARGRAGPVVVLGVLTVLAVLGGVGVADAVASGDLETAGGVAVLLGVPYWHVQHYRKHPDERPGAQFRPW